jgi:hypothetical protein
LGLRQGNRQTFDDGAILAWLDTEGQVSRVEGDAFGDQLGGGLRLSRIYPPDTHRQLRAGLVDV